MGWLSREIKTQPLPQTPQTSTRFMGIELTLDAEGRVQALHSLPFCLARSASSTLWDLLTPESGRDIRLPFENWYGHILDLGFTTEKGVKQARAWLKPDGEHWQLTGIWVDDLIHEHAKEQQRRQLLSAVAKGCLAIRQAPNTYLARSVSQVLSAIAPLLGVQEFALARQHQGQWRLYALADTTSQWWLDMAVDNTLNALARDSSGQLLEHCQLADTQATAIAYPNQRQAQAWLLLNQASNPELSVLRSEDWQLLSAQLSSAVLERLQEVDSDVQSRRISLLQQLLQVGWWGFDPNLQSIELGTFLAERLATDTQLSVPQWLDLLHPADAQELTARLQNLGTTMVFSHSLRLRHAPDEFHWYQLQAQRLSPKGPWHGYLLDIDALKAHEAQTARAHARLNRLVAKAPAVIYVEQCSQGALSLSFVSASLEPLVGWQLAELEAGQLAQYVHPDDLDIFFARNRALLDEGQHRCKYRLKDRQGAYHWLLDEACVLRDEHGAAQEVVGIWLDVTEATLASERIRESEERYRVLVEDSPAMICRYGPDLQLRFVNQPMAQYLERSAEALQGADLRQWLSAEQQERFTTRIAQMNINEPVVTSEICLTLPGCEHAWWVWAERAIFNEQGELTEIQAVGRDNTQVRKTQQQLNQSAKMATLGEMATGMAHEMNQPLHVMRMAIANVLRRIELGSLEPEYLGEKLCRIDAQIKRAARIVDHMRVFGRRSALETQAFDPQKCVYEAQALLDESLKAQNIAVLISCGTEHVKVNGHADQLEQVLINLIVNAKDALVTRREQNPQHKAQIFIDTFTDAKQVRIFVKDNAGGIEPRVMEKIFDPFFTTKEVGKGTGLGLSVSYSIIEQMGGELSVTNEGEGACFCIAVPLYLEQ